MNVPKATLQSNEVDLIHDRWSVEDFERSTLSVAQQGNKISIFASNVLNKDETSAKPSWTGMMRSWGATLLGVQTSTNLFAISQAINAKAMNYIHKVSSLEWTLSPSSKMAKMRKAIEELTILRQNLLVHNDYITKCNQSLFLKDKSIASCPGHDDVLKQVEAAIKKTKRVLKKITSEQAQKNLDQIMLQVQKDIRAGKGIDRYYLRNIYPKIQLEIQKLVPEIKESYQKQIHLMLNRAYLEGLISQVEGGQLQLPTTFREGLKTIGISFAEQDKVLSGAKKQLVQVLRERVNPKEEKNLQQIAPTTLVNSTQAIVLNIAAQVVKSPKTGQPLEPTGQQRLTQFLSILRDYEVNLQGIWKNSQSASIEKALSNIPIDIPKEFKDKCIEQLVQITGEDQMHEIFHAFLASLSQEQGKAIERSLTDLPNDQFDFILQSLKQQFANKGSEEIQQACDRIMAERVDRMVVSYRSEGVESHLQSLKTLVANGFEVDRDFISRDYLRFENLVNKLPLPDQETYRRQYYLEVNSAYLNNLIEKVTEKKMPLPFTIQKGLLAFGYTQQDQESVLETGRVKFLTALHQLQRAEMLIITPLEMIKNVQEEVFTTTASLFLNDKTKTPLNPTERQRLIQILNMIRKFEVSLIQSCHGYFSIGLDRALATLPDDTPEEMVTFYRKELQKMPIEQNVANLMDLFFQLDSLKKLKGSLWDLNSDKFAALVKQVDKEGDTLLEVLAELPSAKEMFDSDFVTELSQLEFKPYFEWFKNNNEHCVFRFNQSAWGNDEMLGEGICFAITYGWLKEMQKNPDRVIRSLEDLGMVIGPSGVPQMGINRFLQASYSVSVHKREIGGNDLPAFVKKKDKVKVKSIPISNNQNISELIREIEKLDKEKLINLADSEGVVELGAYNDTTGHALFMRFNHPKGKYTFGDVNEGTWEYSSLNEMSKAFENYLKVTYRGKEGFKYFKASQFLFEA
jgi:hypothetical protein